MVKQIRVTFTEKEEELYNFIKSKSSATAFLKDLALLEMERQESYINNNDKINIDDLADKVASKLSVDNKKNNSNSSYNNFGITLEDLDDLK